MGLFRTYPIQKQYVAVEPVCHVQSRGRCVTGRFRSDPFGFGVHPHQGRQILETDTMPETMVKAENETKHVRADWTAPKLSSVDMTETCAGANPVNPEGLLGLGS